MQGHFSHTRFLFLLIIVLNTLETKVHITKPEIVYKKHFERDLKYCHKCFETQIKHCLNFFKELKTDERFSFRHFLAFFPERSCKRNNQLVKLKNSQEKIITKKFFNQIEGSEFEYKIEPIKQTFLKQQENLQGMQYVPSKTIDKFIQNLQKFHLNLTEITIWHYLLNNLQPLIFPVLYERDFPIPKTYAVCGFSFYQEYAGDDLYNYFKSDFLTKLKISKQLLEAAIQFSNGFDNYRLYITDLTADNIVYNRIKKKLYFIDLDTIYIVDSRETKYKSLIHKHRYIECSGCFAYSADDIASYNISDINIYSSCQFLREDLYKDQSKGFLHPIPSEVISTYPKLLQLLNKCVDCPDNLCWERFTVAEELITLFEKILNF